jgi:hypothetical protein
MCGVEWGLLLVVVVSTTVKETTKIEHRLKGV